MIEDVAWVLRSGCVPPEIRGATRLVLLGIADAMDRHGVAWPSVSRLATAAGVTPRAVRCALSALIAAGMIEPIGDRRGGRRRPTKYRWADAKTRKQGSGFLPSSQENTEPCFRVWPHKPGSRVPGIGRETRKPASGVNINEEEIDNKPGSLLPPKHQEAPEKRGRREMFASTTPPDDEDGAPPPIGMDQILKDHGMATDHDATAEVVDLLRSVAQSEGREDTMEVRAEILANLVGRARSAGAPRIRWARDLAQAVESRAGSAEEAQRRRRYEEDIERMREALGPEIVALRARHAAVGGRDAAKDRTIDTWLAQGRVHAAGILIAGLERTAREEERDVG